MSTNITQSHILEKSIDWCGAKLTLQSGKIAKQADSAIFTVMGDTRILTTLVVNKTVSSSATFLPLTVHYQEMMSATGRIPGGFIKREGKPSEQEILVSRLIDRSIRPLFHSDFFHEVQITSTLWSYDPNTDPSILSIIGASAALALSGIPLKSIIGAIRVGLVNDEVVINPQLTQLKKSKLDLVISGDQDNITMIESSANEISEESIASCIKQGVEHMSPVVDFIKDIKATAGKEFSYSGVSQEQSMRDNIASKYSSEIYQGLKITTKYNRDQYFYNLQAEVSAELSAGQDDQVSGINDAFEAAKDTLIRKNILEDGLRINGRTAIEIRDISCETGILPRTHGSSLFTRGETQAMASITLGTTEDEQVVSNIFGEYRESFFLHYAFPPYSVGQCSNPRAPTRREIGHGRLAFKAIERMIPHNKDFPYTIRALCEITESNGSSSQATVCATTLALMDAGIPIKSMVAGIAMGLIKSGNKEIILSDISGEEDHIGDMDFKVAGTQKGITALQMDSKITDISIGTLVDTMQQAKDGRLYILSEMQKVINEPRKTLNSHAPVLKTINIQKADIKELIGPGGKNIKEICGKTNAKINIGDEGEVHIAASNNKIMTEVIALIHAKVGAPVSIGAKFKGKVVKIINSGIFVNYTGTKDGFVHISEIANERIEDIQQHVREGEMVSVVVIGIDHQKVRLSISKANDPDAIANLSNHSTQPSKPKYNSNNTYRNQKYSKSRHSDRTSEHDGQNGHGGRKYFN